MPRKLAGVRNAYIDENLAAARAGTVEGRVVCRCGGPGRWRLVRHPPRERLEMRKVWLVPFPAQWDPKLGIHVT